MKFKIKFFYLIFFIYLFCFCNNRNKSSINIWSSSNVLSLDSILILKNIYSRDSNAICKNTQLDSFFGDRLLYLLLGCKLKNVSKDTIIVFTNTKYNYFPCLNTALQLKADTVFSYHANCTEIDVDVKLDSICPNEKRLYYIPFSMFPIINHGDVIYAEAAFDAYKLSMRKRTKIDYYRGGEYSDTIIYRHPFLLYINLKNNTVSVVDSTCPTPLS